MWTVTMECNPGTPDEPKNFEDRGAALNYLREQAGADRNVVEREDGTACVDLTPEGSTGSLYLYANPAA